MRNRADASQTYKTDQKGLWRLVQIMARLRSPEGCPWDRKQTMEDLKVYLIDEAYEVLDAVDSGDRGLLCEELGDLLFQIVFLAQLAQEEEAFDMDGVTRGIEKKMIRRHPHVFGDAQVSGAGEVVDQWEIIKATEGKKPRTSVLSGVPDTLPALYRAYRLGLRAGRVGFDWQSREQVLSKVREELNELEQEVRKGDLQAATEELGDLLFVLANLARHLNREPEGLLRKTNIKFVKRFQWLEETLSERGFTPREASLDEMDQLWEEAKAQERQGQVRSAQKTKQEGI
jgi:MazG family protein